MSNFTIDTDFNPGDEIKITFDISNSIPTTETVDTCSSWDDSTNTMGSIPCKTVYIVDLQEGSPHSVEVPLGNAGSEYYVAESENTHWSNVRIGSNAEHYAGASTSDGNYNTNQIINQTGHESSAAKVASDISRVVAGITYNDWYLPTSNQLFNLYNLMSVLDPVIEAQGGSKLRKDHDYAVVKNYWSSTENSLPNHSSTCVVSMSFNPNSGGGGAFGRTKNHKFRVRAVRKETTEQNVSVGDVWGGGVIYKIIDLSSGSGTINTITPSVDLDVAIGFNKTNIFSQNNLGNGYSNTVAESPGIELTITSAHGSSPQISFEYTNSNTGSYTWLTNVKVFKKIEEIVEVVKAGNKTTIAWSENAARWTTRYSFTPEYFSTYKTGFASFVKGELFIHDDSNNKNYFYNGKYPTQISYVENVQPSQPKVFMTHSVEGNSKPNITRFESLDNWTMNSDLNSNDYVSREGTYYSEMFGDTNDPNVGDNSTYGDRLMKGTKLRGQYLKVFMAFRENDLEVKHSNIGFITSKGHTTQEPIPQYRQPRTRK